MHAEETGGAADRQQRLGRGCARRGPPGVGIGRLQAQCQVIDRVDNPTGPATHTKVPRDFADVLRERSGALGIGCDQRRIGIERVHGAILAQRGPVEQEWRAQLEMEMRAHALRFGIAGATDRANHLAARDVRARIDPHPIHMRE